MAIVAFIGSNIVKSVSSRLISTASQAVAKETAHGEDRGGAQISPQGRFMSQLQQLQQQDPTRFKQFMADQASKLQDEAARATGPQARHLGDVASKFQEAASSGQLPNLQPGTEGGETVSPLRGTEGGVSGGSSATRAVRAYQANSHPHLVSPRPGGVQQLLVGMASELASVLSGAT